MLPSVRSTLLHILSSAILALVNEGNRAQRPLARVLMRHPFRLGVALLLVLLILIHFIDTYRLWIPGRTPLLIRVTDQLESFSTIRITDLATGEEMFQTTSLLGRSLFFLPPGRYEVCGFQGAPSLTAGCTDITVGTNPAAITLLFYAY